MPQQHRSHKFFPESTRRKEFLVRVAGTPGSESSARGSTSEMNKRPKLGRRQAALSGGNWVAGGGHLDDWPWVSAREGVGPQALKGRPCDGE